MSDAALAETARLYSGHEIACHTVSHGWCANMPAVSVLNETLKDRLILEKIAGYPVCGMSYPSGSYSEESISVMKSCGIVYSRTTLSNRNFILPENFMLWHPTCHHREALQLTDEFMGNLDSEWKRPLFYTWGHSHELRTEQDWDNMKRICETLAGNEKIWYATNIEIYRYMTDCRRLVVSADVRGAHTHHDASAALFVTTQHRICAYQCRHVVLLVVEAARKRYPVLLGARLHRQVRHVEALDIQIFGPQIECQ